MNCSAIPIIVTISYLVGEIYKTVFKSQSAKRLIPVAMAVIGAALGVAIFITAPEKIFVSNIWDAILIGIVSGESATGTNQIIKQLFAKGVNKDED